MSVHMRQRRTYRHRKEGHEKMEAEIGVSSYKPSNTRNYQKLEEARKDPP